MSVIKIATGTLYTKGFISSLGPSAVDVVMALKIDTQVHKWLYNSSGTGFVANPG